VTHMVARISEEAQPLAIWWIAFVDRLSAAD
jgi:hypothetical protein